MVNLIETGLDAGFGPSKGTRRVKKSMDSRKAEQARAKAAAKTAGFALYSQK
jgi:hypothetical protein